MAAVQGDVQIQFIDEDDFPLANFIEHQASDHEIYSDESEQEKMRGQRGKLSVQPLGYVMSTKVIFRRAKVFVLAEVCLPRRPRVF